MPNMAPVQVHDASQPRRGPTSRDWEEHREELTRLYLVDGMKLDAVINLMGNKYNFHASPRQYQERFRQWRVRKNITRRVREDMVQQEAHGTLILDSDARRRLARQARSHPDRHIPSSHTLSSEDLIIVTTPDSSTVSHSGQSLREIGSIMESINDDTSFAQQVSSPDTPAVLVTSDTGIVQPWRGDFRLSTSPPTGISKENSSMQAAGDAISTELSISPSPPRMPSASNNAEIIFFNLRQFCDHFACNDALPRTAEGDHSSMSNTLVQKSTNDLKDIIYLYKIGSYPRADFFLQNYCSLPFEFVIEQSIEFVRQIITTLAPINTTRKPQVRHHLLEHLYRLTKTNLGPWHPFTVICKHLSLDQDSLEISMRALKLLQNSVLTWSRLMSFRTELDLVQMTRREQNYDAALYKARILVDTSTIVFGPNSEPVRKAKMELSNIYIAQQDYTAAINTCLEICNLQKDMLAVRAMENLAEVYRLQSDPVSCALWLENSFNLILENDDSPVATVHILDKLAETLNEIGGLASQEKIRHCNEKYALYLQP